jgi:hypothetical protein
VTKKFDGTTFFVSTDFILVMFSITFGECRTLLTERLEIAGKEMSKTHISRCIRRGRHCQIKQNIITVQEREGGFIKNRQKSMFLVP